MISNRSCCRTMKLWALQYCICGRGNDGVSPSVDDGGVTQDSLEALELLDSVHLTAGNTPVCAR